MQAVPRNRRHDTLWLGRYGADMAPVAPYGSWHSVVSAADVVAGDRASGPAEPLE